MKVAITGVAGRLGGALVRRLESDPAVTSVLGLDLRDPGVHSGKMAFVRADVRTADFARLLRGVDALVHLAFVVEQPRGMRAEEVDAVNLEGSLRVFRGALEAGVGRLVFCSSVAAYGAHVDNPVPLTESMPLRPNPGWRYACAKAELEGFLERLEGKHPGKVIIRFRPAIVVGPGLRSILDSHRTGGRILCFDPAGKVDFCGEEDVAEAFRLALAAPRSGVYNLAAEGPLSFLEIAELLGQPLFRARRAWLLPLLRMGVLAGLISKGDLEWLSPGSDGPILVDAGKARRELGWMPRRGARGVLAEWLEGRKRG